MSNSKFIEAARADCEAMYDDCEMVAYLAELYEVLHNLASDVYHIDSHWVFADEAMHDCEERLT